MGDFVYRGNFDCVGYQPCGLAGQLVDVGNCRGVLDFEAGRRGGLVECHRAGNYGRDGGRGRAAGIIDEFSPSSESGRGAQSAGYAIVGSIVGGIFGLGVGIPVPVFGSIVGSLLFGSLGAMAGAVYGEVSSGETFSQAFRIGQAAFVGRALGTLAKMLVGLLIVGTAIVGMVV